MTTPESSPKPAEAAIARKYADLFAAKLQVNLGDERADFGDIILEAHAAIQRGDGQTADLEELKALYRKDYGHAWESRTKGGI